MSRKVRDFRKTRFYGDQLPVSCFKLVPPAPLTKAVSLAKDLRFLVLDVNACDTNYTNWLCPETTDRTILELYSFLHLLNRIFYFADIECCLYVQQKERLVPGTVLVRKEIVAGHFLYFGFDRQALEELLPVCLTLALMINANHFDIREIFVDPLCIERLKAAAGNFNATKGVGISVAGACPKGKNVLGVLGTFKTLKEMQKLLLTYHRVSDNRSETYDHIENEDGPSTQEPQSQSQYDQVRNNVLRVLDTEDTTVFAEGLLKLLSGPFLFQHSFRMVRSYREMRDLIALHGRDVGLTERQIRRVVSCEQQEFVSTIKEVTDAPIMEIRSRVLLECLQNAVRRYHWESVYSVTPDIEYRFRLDLTGGIAWEVRDEDMQTPFCSPLYTMVFPREGVDKGMQLLKEVMDFVSLDNMDEMQRQLEAYSAVVAQERVGEFADMKSAVLYRQGVVEDVARKYPLFTNIRTLLTTLANVLQPGSKVQDLYRGSFAELMGKLVEDAVRNPDKPMSPSLESLVSSYPTLVDPTRNFQRLHLNSLVNPRTGKFVIAVQHPFDETFEMSDSLLINDCFSYLNASHSQLPVETIQLRLAATSGVCIEVKKIWLGWQGPPGNGKSTCAKTVLHGISASEGLLIRGMVREMDSTTTASLKSLNDDPLRHCNGVAFVNELNDGGNDKSGTLKDDSSEKSTLMKNFFDSGMSAVYRARVNETSNEVRQDVQHVIFDCVWVVLGNELSLCPSLRDRMLIHTINRTAAATADRMTLADIFGRMDRFKVGHFEILKLLVIAFVSIFEFVGCSLEDADYLNDMERLAFHVMDREFRAMHLDANFLGRGRLLDNIRSLVHMLAIHRAVLIVLGCVDTFRVHWEEHKPEVESLDDYSQRTMRRVVKDLNCMTLHELVRRVQEVYCPSPADYIAVATMQCFDQNPYFPMFRAIAREVIDPVYIEHTSDGRKIFVVQNMTYARICEILNSQRIPLESKEIRSTFQAMMNSITRDGIPVVTIANQQGTRSNDGGQATTLFQLTFDARVAAEVVIESDMMQLVTQLTSDIQERITTVVREACSRATLHRWFPNEKVTVDAKPYGNDANRFFGFLGQLRPNGWTLRHATQVVVGFVQDSRVVDVSIDFNHARLKLMRNWMLQCAESSENVDKEKGYVRVPQVKQCGIVVSTISVCDTFKDGMSLASDGGSLLPFYKAGSTVYVHQALLILRLGVTEDLARQLRQICSPPNHPIEYWTFDSKQNPEILKSLEKTESLPVDAKYTTKADALVCEQDLDGRDSGAWLHVSIQSRLESVLSSSMSMSPGVAKEFATRCLRKNLTDRKTVLYFNKRSTGPALDVIKVDEVRSSCGGQLPCAQLPCQKRQEVITASMAMIQEGHNTTLGAKRERATTFPCQHETNYITRKYLASSGKLKEIQDSCRAAYGNDFERQEQAIEERMEKLTKEWISKVKNRYRPLRLGPAVSLVSEFIDQDGRRTKTRDRGVKRSRQQME